jgi:hypothetical protein
VSYRTVAQLDSLGALLTSWFPGYFTRIRLPEPSVQGRPVYALRLRAGGGGERRGVLLIGGTHARELLNPDAIIELAVDLFVSHVNGTDLVYGGKRWTAAEVKLVLETLDLWLVPCINPDGREYVMTVDRLWRKNRRDNPGTPYDGVDLNRNYDVLWGVTQGQTSCAPSSEVYCGSSAFSEPETRNVRYLLDEKRIDCFADVHSYSELILWPWGHATSQTTNPGSNFTTLPSGTCQPIGTPGYQEYIPSRDRQRFQTVGARIQDAIRAVRGHTYANQASIALYPTTGTASNYAYSRHLASSRRRRTYGYTFETGPWMGSVLESFQPTDPVPVKREAKSGMIALMQQCICAIELIGGSLFRGETELNRLRGIRDKLLATTEAGRDWIALFERVQTPLLTALMGDEKLLSQAGDLVRRAAELAKEDTGELSEEDVRTATSVLRSLTRHSDDPAVRRDLKKVQTTLESLRGQSFRTAVEHLMSENPGASRASRLRK